jgi:hypothetical protein
MPNRSYFEIFPCTEFGQFLRPTDLEPTVEMKQALEKISGYHVEQNISSLKINDACWDHFEGDMRFYSLQFPDIIFYVIGEADEYQNYWHANFLNGKGCVKQAEITYPEIKLEELV